MKIDIHTPLTIDSLSGYEVPGHALQLSQEAWSAVDRARNFLDRKMASSDRPVYGINTGFGALHNVAISHDELGILQENLVMSHACGTGEEIPHEVVRLMLLLKIRGLAYGHSGVSTDTIERLIWMYNEDVIPVVYEYGSLGASGDLAPLAHLCLPLIGKGEVVWKGKRCKAAEVLTQQGLEPLKLQSKEGLALLNGTQFMSAWACRLMLLSEELFNWSNCIAALSIDAFDGRIEPFMAALHQIRPHPGQIHVSSRIRSLLEGSEGMGRPRQHVQDPYSFRCIPQVHGASYDVLSYVRRTVETEINSVTDNPTLFPEQDLIVSGGNFHGQPLAIALDMLCLAMHELGNISERRIYQLISGSRGLPPFLVSKPGLNSGMMIPQYTAAALVSHNKTLCTPSSADSIVSSNGQEDHVSMGANAAIKCAKVVKNVKTILAIELLNAAQAFDFRSGITSSPPLENLRKAFRKKISKMENDRELYTDIAAAISFLDEYILPDANKGV